MNTKRYAIANKNTVSVPRNISTTPSRYGVSSYHAIRSFATRAAARIAKQRYKNPQNYSIIDKYENCVVR